MYLDSMLDKGTANLKYSPHKEMQDVSKQHPFQFNGFVVFFVVSKIWRKINGGDDNQ